MLIASSAGHEEIANFLVGKGAAVNACTDQARTSLIYACSRNRHGIAKMLLDNHADINWQDTFGASPLHRAASRGHVRFVTTSELSPN